MTALVFSNVDKGRVFTAAHGYAIKRDGDNPAYWMAFRPGANGKPCFDPSHELGSGAGDQGWLKCVRACEAHQEGRSVALAKSAPVTPTQTKTPRADAEARSNEPKQRGLL